MFIKTLYNIYEVENITTSKDAYYVGEMAVIRKNQVIAKAKKLTDLIDEFAIEDKIFSWSEINNPVSAIDFFKDCSETAKLYGILNINNKKKKIIEYNRTSQTWKLLKKY